MSKIRFTNAREALESLLDRHEANPASTRLFVYPDVEGFVHAHSVELFEKQLKTAADYGAISLRFGQGRRRNIIEAAKLTNPDVLYEFLSRTPATRQSADAISQLTRSLGTIQLPSQLRDELLEKWQRAKQWGRYSAENWEELICPIQLAHGIVERSRRLNTHPDLDFRTFSRRVCGNSKALEGNLTAVISIARQIDPACCADESHAPVDHLSSLGLEKIPQPILISGPVRQLRDTGWSFLGVPPQQIGTIEYVTRPRALLTIENYVSFVRYCEECNPSQADLVLYTGGFPSRATQALFKQICTLIPSNQLYHWGDIDFDGLRIFHFLDQLAGGQLRSHQMRIDQPVNRAADEMRTAPFDLPVNSDVYESYCALKSGALPVEQEQLDPVALPSN
ncbi:hypothetical protein ABIE64_003644 [Thalassospira sp. MBR-102]|uniref:Wadjet anti-phage system protein JetD domain-containing protein n=1 Tax=Thalassospira sp. MBR-102 TaxID=3156466 RepID=UPI00339B3715